MKNTDENVLSTASIVIPHTAHHKNPQKITINFESITPDMAREFLEKNSQKQRKVNARSVKSYADQMRKGLWYGDNGESIKFSHSGLIDGQHRLLGVIEYGKPVVMMVMRGLPDEHILAMDMGKKRNLSDILKIHGHEPVKGLSNSMIATLLNGIYVTKAYIESGAQSNSMRLAIPRGAQGAPLEIFEFFMANPSIAQSVAKLKNYKIASITKQFPIGPLLLSWYIVNSIDEEVADTILRTFEEMTPQTPQGIDCPAYKVMQKITKMRAMGETLHRYEYPAMILWAMDNMINGLSQKRIDLKQKHMPSNGHQGSDVLKAHFEALELTQ